MNIKAVEITQNGKKLFVTKIKVKDILEKYRIDIFDPSTNKGYQRELSKQRIRDFSVYVREGFKISPMNILISIRKKDLNYNDGFLEIPDNETWWVVDGQHRIEGLRDAIKKDKKIEDYEIPLTIVPFENVYEEALQFLIINRTQKPIRTDLAERILKEGLEKKGLEKLIEMREKGTLKRVLGGIEWKPIAIEITEFLNRDPESVWYKKIKMPNEKSKDSLVAQKSFTDSLEPILTHPIFGVLPKETLVIAIRNYWQAIKKLYTKSFEEPKNYVIQKTTGVFVFHKLFVIVASKALNKQGKYELTIDKFETILKHMDPEYIKDEVWMSSDKKHGIEGGLFSRMGTSKKTFSIIYEMIARSIENEWAEQEDGKPEIIV